MKKVLFVLVILTLVINAKAQTKSTDWDILSNYIRVENNYTFEKVDSFNIKLTGTFITYNIYKDYKIVAKELKYLPDLNEGKYQTLLIPLKDSNPIVKFNYNISLKNFYIYFWTNPKGRANEINIKDLDDKRIKKLLAL